MYCDEAIILSLFFSFNETHTTYDHIWKCIHCHQIQVFQNQNFSPHRSVNVFNLFIVPYMYCTVPLPSILQLKHPKTTLHLQGEAFLLL